ncbi:MAG: ATP-binding protein [Patescibacteria group bacterium]|jgi:signal transduction histidine kinase
MDYINIIILVVLILNILLGYFIYKNNKHASVNRSYLFVIVAIIFWGTGMILYRLSDQANIVFLCKLLYVFATFTSPAFLFFSIVFPEGGKLNPKYIIFVSVFFILINGMILFTDRIIFSAKTVVDGENIIYFGKLYILYVVYFFYHFFQAFYNLNSKIKKLEGLKKLQVKYVFSGYLLSSNLAFISNLLLPWFGIFTINWSGQVLTIFMVGFTTYAIVKYRLMDIRLVLIRSVLYGILVALFASFFAMVVFLSGTYLSRENQSGNAIIFVVTSLVIVLTLDPLKSIFARLTDRIFYKNRVDYQKLLQKASSVVAKEIDLAKFSLALVNLLSDQLKIRLISSLILKNGEWILIASSQLDSAPPKFNINFIQFIINKKELIIVEELIRDHSNISSEVPYYKILGNFIQEAENLKIEMIVPVSGEDGSLTSMLFFSAKSSGDLYSQDDINFLKILTPQIATAIEKSKLYEEVQLQKRDLQVKVDAKTKSLKIANVGLEQRNKFLTAMQAVTNKVGRTMDLKQINQMIANSIYSEFGYVGGVLSFVDERTNVLRIGAITESEQTKLVTQILGQDPKKFEAKLEAGYSLGVKTVLSGTRNDSDKMSDFFSPPVDKLVMDKVQEALGVKAIVGFPIFSEDKIIGIIHFLLAVEKSKVTSLDLDTMTALTSQVGIVSRNLRLYNNLQTTNQDLQIANMRLRELDQAKSEFLSIASHQLRTPISALKGYLSMISDGDFGPVTPKVGKVIKDLFESAARLARLVNIFLNVSRIESGRLKIEKKPLQISDMIDSVIAELHNESDKKGVKLIYKKSKPALPLVAADSDKLREVILNLIDNSIKYTPKGQIEVSAFIEGENFHFQVQDTGIGIDPEEAKNLFRKFVRASGAAQIHTGGSGLGLFIAQKIIKEHGGQIWVESAGKEKGSIFQFVIPVSGGEPNKEEMQS